MCDKGEQGELGITEEQLEETLYIGGEVIKRIVYSIPLDYRAFTKEDYRRYILATSKENNGYARVDIFDKIWNDISKGYNFIIATGEGNNLHFFSVDYFNNEILK